jgi:hypothetical protein
LLLLECDSCVENYAGTILMDTARRSEAWAPAQQHAQVDIANIVSRLSHAAKDGVKTTAPASAIDVLRLLTRAIRDRPC